MSTNVEVRNVIITTNVSGTFVEWEVPSWTINGSNVNFSLAFTPIPDSACVYINGIRLKKTLDYTVLSNIITFVTAPIAWDVIVTDYIY